MSSKEFEAQLTLKDRLNYPYLLANQILTFQKALLTQEFSEKQVKETIRGLVRLIPESWHDNQFKKDVEDATKTEKIDMRPLVAGRIRVSEQVCKELGIVAFKEVESFNHYEVFQACINLLDRRGLTSRRTFIEKMTGRPTGGIDIANTEVDEL